MIVVTGASRGLGRAVADRLVAQGMPIIGLARTVPDDAPFPFVSCDVGSHDAVAEARRAIAGKYGPVSGLIAAAGIASMNLTVMTPPATVERLIRTNLLGTIYCCQAFAPSMIRQRRGTIVTFSTIAVLLAIQGEAVYAASKAGVETFTRAFAREVADFGIRANCIAPGPIDTGLLRGVPEAKIAEVVARQVLPWRFTADAVCDLVELLLDPRAAMLSGTVLPVGGV